MGRFKGDRILIQMSVWRKFLHLEEIVYFLKDYHWLTITSCQNPVISCFIKIHSGLTFLLAASKIVLLGDTHTHLMTLWPGLPGWAGTRKVKPIWILLKQETVSGSGISWAPCKSAPRSRQITTPAPHHSVFLQAGCPSCHPTNSINALKASVQLGDCSKKI